MTQSRTETSIVRYSRVRAKEEAVTIWAFASTQYPLDHRVIQEEATVLLIEAVSSFATNARRALESIPGRSGIPLNRARWQWTPVKGGEVVTDLWDSLNRVIHAKKLNVGWEKLPPNVSGFEHGAIVIPYIQAETDRFEMAFIDPFAMAYAFLYRALPMLESASDPVQVQ
jgi:hypothetical protein